MRLRRSKPRTAGRGRGKAADSLRCESLRYPATNLAFGKAAESLESETLRYLLLQVGVRFLGVPFKRISHHSAPDLDSLIVQERELRDEPFRSPAGVSDSCPSGSRAPPSGQETRTAKAAARAACSAVPGAKVTTSENGLIDSICSVRSIAKEVYSFLISSKFYEHFLPLASLFSDPQNFCLK